MIKKSILFFWFTLFVFPFAALSQDVDFAALDQYFRKTQQKFELPGMAIAIVKDGDIVFQQGYGFRDVENEIRVTPNTNFAIASISKAFCAASIAQLVEEGKLNWDDKVTDHLPYFKLHDPVVTQLITVEDLLCHRSGLGTFDGDLLTYGTSYTAEEALTRLSELPLKNEFRNTFGYNNLMFIAAGEIIHKVSGKDWFDYVREEIFNPLGMNKSVSSVRQFTDKMEVAYPYVKGEKDDIRSYDTWSSSASINSNVVDMSRWISMWLENGTYNEGQDTLLSQRSIAKIFTPHINIPVSGFYEQFGTHFRGYGLGWFLRDYRGKLLAHHGGGLPGYISKIAIVPEEKLGMIILTNGESYAPEALMYAILDAYLYDGKETKDWADTFYGFQQNGDRQDEEDQQNRVKARVLKTDPSHDLEAYEGRYTDKMYGTATVTKKGNQLMLSLDPAQKIFTSTLKHWHYDTFEIDFEDKFLPKGYVTFETDVDGNISGFKIDLPNPDFHFFHLHFQR